MRGRMALDAPPTCGEMSTPGSPQSGCPSGSGSGSVTSSAARIRPRPHVVDERIGVDERSAADVHDQRAVGKGREERVVDDVPRRIAPGKRHDHDLGAGEQLGQLVDGVHRHPVFVACAARDGSELDLEGREPRGDGLADSAVAEQQHPAVGEALARRRAPTRPVDVSTRERVEPALRREREGDGELGGRGLVHRRGVRERAGPRAAMSATPS